MSLIPTATMLFSVETKTALGRSYPDPPDKWCEAGGTLVFNDVDKRWRYQFDEGQWVSEPSRLIGYTEQYFAVGLGSILVDGNKGRWEFYDGREVDTDFYPYMRLLLRLGAGFTGAFSITLTDTRGQKVHRNEFTAVGTFVSVEEYVGSQNASLWVVDVGNTRPFDWKTVKSIEWVAEGGGGVADNLWIDEFHFSYEVGGFRAIVVYVDFLDPNTKKYVPVAGATVALGRPLVTGGYWYDLSNPKTTDDEGKCNFTALDSIEGPFAVMVDAVDLGFEVGYITGIDLSTSDQVVTVHLEGEPGFDWKRFVKYTFYGGIAVAVVLTVGGIAREAAG